MLKTQICVTRLNVLRVTVQWYLFFMKLSTPWRWGRNRVELLESIEIGLCLAVHMLCWVSAGSFSETCAVVYIDNHLSYVWRKCPPLYAVNFFTSFKEPPKILRNKKPPVISQWCRCHACGDKKVHCNTRIVKYGRLCPVDFKFQFNEQIWTCVHFYL